MSICAELLMVRQLSIQSAYVVFVRKDVYKLNLVDRIKYLYVRAVTLHR